MSQKHTNDAAKRNEIAARRRAVAQMSLAYVPQNQIAAELGVSPATVSADLKELREAWLEEAKESLGHRVSQELASLDQLEAHLWQQFTARATPPDTKTRTGLAILKVKERRARMLGLDEPDRLEISMSDEQLEAEILVLREELGHDEPRALPG